MRFSAYNNKKPEQRLSSGYLWMFFCFVSVQQVGAKDKDYSVLPKEAWEDCIELCLAASWGHKVKVKLPKTKPEWRLTQLTFIHKTSPHPITQGVDANQPIVAHCAPCLLINHWPFPSTAKTSSQKISPVFNSIENGGGLWNYIEDGAHVLSLLVIIHLRMYNLFLLF